ncbi:UBXN7 [Bugula neritina]|uniref:UBXN7 n=1 Tax=Bugula neritina TaxID=10212 RepID=A0A7J7KDG7_BUGNE|nr:UBXN7 [Bugula neritina]
MEEQDLIANFLTVTGVTDADVAKNYLEACGGNLDLAVSMHMDSNGAVAEASPSRSASCEEVRAPIPQKREILVEHDHYLLANERKRRRTHRDSVFDKFRDFQAEAREQERRLKNGEESSISSQRLSKLEDLFRPPLDIIHHGSFESVQAKAKLDNRWILVNIQNTAEFSCQVLNRDIWKDPHIRSLVCKHFIFWQVYHDSAEGSKFIQFYPVAHWPYISILHPLTAELQHTWNAVTLKSFTQELEEFIRVHCKPDGTECSSLTNSPYKIAINPKLEASEELQLEAAIQASLVESQQKEDLVYESDSGSELETFSGSDSGSSDHEDSKPSKNKGKQLQSGVQSVKCSQSATGNTTPSNSVHNTSHTDSTQNILSRQSPHDTHPESSDWREYTSVHGTDIQILLRKPDQSRCQWCVKSQSKLKALVLYVSSLGFDERKYEIVSNFPRRRISELPLEQTFSDLDFQKQEMFYIQER